MIQPQVRVFLQVFGLALLSCILIMLTYSASFAGDGGSQANSVPPPPPDGDTGRCGYIVSTTICSSYTNLGISCGGGKTVHRIEDFVQWNLSKGKKFGNLTGTGGDTCGFIFTNPTCESYCTGP